MALKAYKERTFKANIIFEEDKSIKEVVFRLPRNIDSHSSADGNLGLDLLYTLSNMAKPFSTSVEVELENGSIVNVFTLRELINLGVAMDHADAFSEWFKAREAEQAEKDRLSKKLESAGGSGKKGTHQAKD